MNKLTTKLLSLSAVMLLFMAFSASSALAQNYAKPNGKNIVAPAADCDDFADPCNLATAVREAIGEGGTTVTAILPNDGGTLIFQEDLDGTAKITATVTFDATLTDGGSGVDGFIAVDGDIEIDGAATLTILQNVEVRLVGQPSRLILNDGATIDGDGFFAFTATGGDHLILLGDPFVTCSSPGVSPNVAFIENTRVDKTNGDVRVDDECSNDGPSLLTFTNRLQVDAGTLDGGDNNFNVTSVDASDLTPDPGVVIASAAIIKGTGTFFIQVEEPTAGGAGFENTSADCFTILGAGNMNMAFDKVTNAGVCIDLDEIGAGGFSFNRSGTLFVRKAVQLNGSFLNESLAGVNFTSGARTEFWKLETITTDLAIVGPGDETLDPTGRFINAPTVGRCETLNGVAGNESGVYFFTPVDIEGDLVMTNTDDPTTVDATSGNACIEGLWFIGNDAQQGSALAKSAGPADHQEESTIEGDFNSTVDPGEANGVYLDSGPGKKGTVHNVAFQGDFGFDDPSPTFTLVAPADASPVGDLCEAYSNEADGNKVLFTGSADQTLRYTDADDGVDGSSLYIPSVQIKKTNTGDRVVIDDDGSPP
ncbi:MAG: hypothetical protein IH820_16550, partial [Bacteroidetes bacterium]|nr:hypothetical protein [Bacteroidota bacterium]